MYLDAYRRIVAWAQPQIARLSRPPSPWADAHLALERPAERRLAVVALRLGDAGQRLAPRAQPVRRQLDAPAGQGFDLWLAQELVEPFPWRWAPTWMPSLTESESRGGWAIRAGRGFDSVVLRE